MISAVEFKRVEDRGVDQVIALQEAAELEVLTDGELRRAIFTGPLTETLTGLEHVRGVTHTWCIAESPIEEELPVMVFGKFAARRTTRIEDLTYGRAHAGEGDAGQPADDVPTLVPGALHRRLGRPVRDGRRRRGDRARGGP